MQPPSHDGGSCRLPSSAETGSVRSLAVTATGLEPARPPTSPPADTGEPVLRPRHPRDVDAVSAPSAFVPAVDNVHDRAAYLAARLRTDLEIIHPANVDESLTSRCLLAELALVPTAPD